MTAARPDLPILSDGVVRLRPFAANDAAALAAIWLDPDIRARNTVPEPSQPRPRIVWRATRQRRRQATHGNGRLSTSPPTALPAGGRALKNIRGESRRAEAACWVAAEFRGRRFAARSLRLAATFAFSSGLIRVQAHCEADNAASVRSVLAAGMRHEGTLRSYFISNAGIPTDAEISAWFPMT